MSRVTKIVEREPQTLVVVPKEFGDDRLASERLLDHIADRSLDPFSYEELKRRQYAVDDGHQLAGVFGYLCDTGRLVQQDELPATDFSAEEQELLAAFREYLNNEQGWEPARAALPDLSDDEVYGEAYAQLEAVGAISRQGAYHFFTDDAWNAIYAETGEPVYGRADFLR